MKLKASGLLETTAALSILAFVIAASLFQIGRLASWSRTDMGAVYLAVNQVENTRLSQPMEIAEGTYMVERQVTSYSQGLDVLTIVARDRGGRVLLKVRKLIRHEDER
ncbi:MAG: hypothetical protein GC178_01775 [Flavobacteriales bacterium]|nr:hypothetical protein [Flavobacteriales bacterium]